MLRTGLVLLLLGFAVLRVGLLRRIVLRLVFREPLVYDREMGFGTATLSLPLEIATVCGSDEKRMVELRGLKPLTSAMRMQRSPS